jgi:hypothetical protein
VNSQDPTLARLEDQIAWYSEKSLNAQRWFKGLKVFQIAAAAGVPIMIALSVPSSRPNSLAAVLGGLVAIVEGIQGLNQYQQNWILYRSTCEALKHEKFLYLGRAGPYADDDSARRILAEKIEGLVSQEHAKWTSAREETGAIRDDGTREPSP